ncbi:MAG: CHASE2 domain-containing protein [Leptolyngbyaceae bacterium]|nr:CHASE2 domain-containing protein [Leptolyngbyaceae bacterium]
MGKLVVLKVGEGSLGQGFPVTLQIGEEEDGIPSRSHAGGIALGCATRPLLEITGKLPPDPELPQCYDRWRAAYLDLGSHFRLEAPTTQIKNVSRIEDCNLAGKALRDRFNLWLQSASFREIREKLLEKLLPTDSVRVIVQVKEIELQRLPWHLWDVCDRFPRAEIALSPPHYERVELASPLIVPRLPKTKVKVLAILGNSIGIDTDADRKLLEQLPDVEIKFLVEPKRQELNDELWEQPWDLLFFAGHSSSCGQDLTGRIFLNSTDSYTIADLRYALKKAVEHGLKLAIFNSCDGLGLARDLADLQIPQMIVMREPVPDLVAQVFLKYFIEPFAQGQPLYSAVRAARERLQGLEDQFPCASWLPQIYQNPAEVPVTWQGFIHTALDETGNGSITVNNPAIQFPPPPLPRRGSLSALVGISFAIAVVVGGIRFLGLIQPWELQAFDALLTQRPDEQPDSRLLIVTINDQEIKDHAGDRASLSNRTLQQLLDKLTAAKPSVIGLDLYRDIPIAPAQAGLAKYFQQDSKLIGICKVNEPESNIDGSAPPPGMPNERLGFSDFLPDNDGILRRHLLYMTPDVTSPCRTSYSFNFQLAAHYLKAMKGISYQFNQDGDIQFGTTVLKRLHPHMGGYQRWEGGGNQILLNYGSVSKPAAQVSLTQVLSGAIAPDDIKDRVVLVGVTANSSGDIWSTPYGAGPLKQVPGVLIQAQMVSHLLKAILDQRPLLWVLPLWGDGIWIWGWSVVGGLLAWQLRSPLYLGLAICITSGGVVFLCSALLYQGGWMPLVPALLALAGSGVIVGIYLAEPSRPSSLPPSL